MSTKITKSLLAISLLTSLVAMSASAYAGVTISDKRYWPSEAGPGAYRTVTAQRVPRDAFAALGENSQSSMPRYLGGPKSGVIANQVSVGHAHPGGR